jgi:hypothetical protein
LKSGLVRATANGGKAETAKAVIAWIDERQGRDIELFDVVLLGFSTEEKP